jgi:lipoic acid synthetase
MITLRVENPAGPKPDWLTIKAPLTGQYPQVKSTLKRLGLHTVCEESHCPNIPDCWNTGTATFMVLGKTCTRGCRFCQVEAAAHGDALDPEEPRKVAEAVAEWGLDYVVITSVDRDDLPDQGASHFADCVREIKRADADVIVEVLIPDFRGETRRVQQIIDARPDVIAHNIETTRALQRKVRDPRAGYDQSLAVLRYVKETDCERFTKSSIIVGFGEKDEDVIQTFKDLRAAGVEIVTIGQYLRPSSWHLPVQEYVPPGKFDWYRREAEQLGFLYAAAGPFVRSSYKAGEYFLKTAIARRRGE